MENELFGHEKGAFTGADRRQAGRFEAAAGGTLLLDEAGELAPAVQGKVLRVLEERTFERVGGSLTLTADVRLVAATNRPLERMVEEGAFRSDLYFRLAVFPIELPPLRERPSDVPLLARHLLERAARRHDLAVPRLTADGEALLAAQQWPGNVRELANVIEHACILCERPPIRAEDLPQRFAARGLRLRTGPITLRDLEMHAIREAVERHNGNKADAAEELGVSLKTLYNKLNADAQLERSA
jgi:two-component system NtrC family response regulator